MKILWRLAFPVALAFALLFIAACSRDPNVVKQKYFASGTAYFQKQKYREAAIQFANAAKVDPKFAEAHYQLAQSYIRLALWSGAYQELSRTVELQPDNLKAQFELGDLLFRSSQFELAASSAQAILQKDPSSADGHLLAANAAAGLKDMPTAVKEMQKANQFAPDRSDLYVNMAFLQMKANDNASAEETFQKAISVDPKSVTPLLALADFYRSQRRWPQAEQQFHHAVEVEPKNLRARGALAGVYIAEGRKPEAEQLMVETKKLLSGDPEGYRSLGDFYFNTGDQDKALAEYESLYREHPKDLQVKKNYVQLLILQNRLDDAAKLNNEILKRDANDADALLYEAQMLGRQGHTNDAVD